MPTPLFKVAKPAPTVPATEDALSAHKRRVASQFKTDVVKAAVRMLTELDSAHRLHFNSVWDNPELTPQEAFDALGEDATRIVMGSYQVTGFLIEQYTLANVPYTPIAVPEGYSVVPNQDGTITVVQAGK